MSALSTLRRTIAGSWRSWLAITVGFTLAYYLALLAIVIVRIGHLPNYVTWYNYPANALRILRSTPAFGDVLPIIAEEWLVEIGSMNYGYGRGIAEWSLEILPAKLAMVVMLGMLIAASVLLLRRLRACRRGADSGVIAGAGMGAVLVGLTNVTMSWVACCAAPSWVVGLSIVGVGTSTAFALLPYGSLITWLGFTMLLTTTYLLARRCAAADDDQKVVAAPFAAAIPRA